MSFFSWQLFPLSEVWEGGLFGECLATVIFYDISCLTDTGVPHEFEIALSLESNKNAVQMQGQKICSGKIYVLA